MAPPLALQVLNVDVENALEPLRPSHRCPPFCGRWGSPFTMAFLPLPRFAGVTNAQCLLLGANTQCPNSGFIEASSTASGARSSTI